MIWDKHDALMNELDKVYKKTSIKTQNNIQELIDTFGFNKDNLYKISDNKTKRRINEYIEDWKDRGYLKDDYFKVLCNNIYNRINVKNSEILEVLIYSCYIEEQTNLDEKEQQVLYEDANYYYQEGIKEVYEVKDIKKQPSVIPMAIFLYLMDQPSYNGFTFEQNEKITLYNKVEQLYKQALMDIQQDRDIDVQNDEYKRIFNTQNNQRLCINKDKISGSMDLTGISLNNKAKVEGIKKEDKDAEVIFIATEDERTTPMCNSMDNMIFYVDKENEFDRYWGETQKDTKIIHVKVKGLVTGVNLPPIDHFFHFCRSSVSYNTKNLKNYVRKNKITENKILDDEIKRALDLLPNNIRNLIEDTDIKICNSNSCYDRKNDIIYLLKDSDVYEILHEIAHAIETKLDILHDDKYIEIQKDGIDINQNYFGNIKGYNAEQEFWIGNKKFVSEYQRKIYENDIDGNYKLNYNNYTFNTKTLGEYFSEGFKYYFKNNTLLKKNDINLYNYIKGILR